MRPTGSGGTDWDAASLFMLEAIVNPRQIAVTRDNPSEYAPEKALALQRAVLGSW